MRIIYIFLLVAFLPLSLHAGSLQATQQAAMEGDARAQYDLAIRYLEGDGIEKDGKSAIKWLKDAAGQDYASAQYKLGMLYREGRRVSTDIDQAIEYFTLAADQGSPSAQYMLGEIYQQGDGIDKDWDEAKEWFELSAGHGFKKAVAALASLEEDEAKVTTEAQIALDALSKTAKAAAAPKNKTTELEPADESAQSAHAVGMKYLRGDGVKKSYKNAEKWFTQAAEQGLAESQYQLGELFNKGRGVKRSKKRANKWYRAAAKQGHVKAKNRLSGCAFC